jgi:hypothetical protein
MEHIMNRKLIAIAVAAVTLASAAPVFAHDWDNSGHARHERYEARRAEIARDRAELRHDLYVHNRFGVRNGREIAQDRAELRRDAWALRH